MEYPHIQEIVDEVHMNYEVPMMDEEYEFSPETEEEINHEGS